MTSTLTNHPTTTTTIGSAELARMMVPADANVAGNVHGGTIMQFMEEAAGVAAHRYFASSAKGRVAALLSRVERLTFQHPIHVGDVAKVRATVVFASQHSVAVCVQVRAERMAWSKARSTITDGDTVCNRALLWLVGAVMLPSTSPAIHPKEYEKALTPAFSMPKDKSSWAWNQFQEAEKLYKERKGKESENSTPIPSQELLLSTPQTVELAQVMLPSDCVNQSGMVSGGVVMKLMDNACGIVAVRHCGTNTVTVAVQGVHLVSPVMLGDCLIVRARPIFNSSKSLEIAVSVRAERYVITEQGWMRQEMVTIATEAYFTFVALPLKGSAAALPMKPLKLESDRDREVFQKRKRQHQMRRAALGKTIRPKL